MRARTTSARVAEISVSATSEAQVRRVAAEAMARPKRTRLADAAQVDLGEVRDPEQADDRCRQGAENREGDDRPVAHWGRAHLRGG